MKTKIKLFMKTLFFINMIFCAMIIKAQNLDSLVARQIDSLRIAHNIPSIAYGVIRNDSIIVINTVGYRDILTKEASQSGDYYSIGSNTKSFTGFLAAKMVEENLIKWDTKFFDLYPELKSESNVVYHNITLKELLSHRARLINFDGSSKAAISQGIMVLTQYKKNVNESLSWPKKRYILIKEILKSEPIPPYGECERSYSNAGFIAAALMLEKVTGQPWESLIINLSKDLELGIHIGIPIDLGVNQPKGHLAPMSMGLDIKKDLIPVQEPVQDELRQLDWFFEFLQLCTPAGKISIKVEDFLKFLQLNIRGINGENNYLKQETYKQMFSSYQSYSIGWWIEPEEWLIYTHRGSTMMFSSFAGISPVEKLGVVIMMNADNPNCITDVIRLLRKNYAKKQ